MHLDHVELSVARGTLTERFCADLDRLLTDVLGWPGETRELFHPIDHVDRRERVYRLPERQYLVLHETDEPGPLGGDDHIGLLVDSTTLDRSFLRRQNTFSAVTRTVSPGLTTRSNSTSDSVKRVTVLSTSSLGNSRPTK